MSKHVVKGNRRKERGNTVASDFWSGRGASRTDWELFSPEKWEWIGDWLSEESTASKNGVGKIDAALILGCALSNIYGPDERLGEVEDEKTGKDFLEDEVRLLKMTSRFLFSGSLA